mgnify:CR=1 FL=1
MNGESPQNAPAEIEMKRLRFSFEVKAMSEDTEFFEFSAYLATWGNIDRVDDVLVKGCFDESLKMLTPKLLWQHRWDDVIGVFTEIKSDDNGLFVKGKLPKADTLVSGRVIPQMKVGSVRSMSVGFSVVEATYNNDTGVRMITKAALFEGSLVDMPVNTKAKVIDMKKFEIGDCEVVKTKREFEALLRESGAFSQKSCVYLASRFREDKPSESGRNSDTAHVIKSLNSITEALRRAGEKS